MCPWKYAKKNPERREMGVKGCLKLFKKMISFGISRLPLFWGNFAKMLLWEWCGEGHGEIRVGES